ncbi:hypothetical protein EVAR_98524_1 [Eumeta japonica]|uniref:Uncharacterized protein n=1 Tax=Eumeta variegata TaxID=151549 RepID=A0A4C1ZVA2_EUMVA|nr:hypothetical protein EVAR_98524_1 [Eumeta japonica]
MSDVGESGPRKKKWANGFRSVVMKMYGDGDIIAISATAERNEAKVSDEKENKNSRKGGHLVGWSFESPYVHSSPAKVVYRKASRSRYGKPKSKYGAPKLKHESTGFGEPPINYVQTPKVTKTYAEPPSDAYNTPLINTYHQYPTGQEFSHDQTRQNYYAGPDHPISPGVSAPAQWQSDYAPNQPFYDNNYEDSYSQQFYSTVNEARPIEDGLLDGQTVNDDYAEQTERFNPKPTIATYPRRILKRKPYTFRSKKASRPQFGDKIIVGGKYAEPPARYVPKFQSSVPTHSDNSFSATNNWMDSEMAGTAGSAVSSYINYKNSNLAFSPQNLNDVFSIVD